MNRRDLLRRALLGVITLATAVLVAACNVPIVPVI